MLIIDIHLFNIQYKMTSVSECCQTKDELRSYMGEDKVKRGGLAPPVDQSFFCWSIAGSWFLMLRY